MTYNDEFLTPFVADDEEFMGDDAEETKELGVEEPGKTEEDEEKEEEEEGGEASGQEF